MFENYEVYDLLRNNDFKTEYKDKNLTSIQLSIERHSSFFTLLSKFINGEKLDKIDLMTYYRLGFERKPLSKDDINIITKEEEKEPLSNDTIERINQKFISAAEIHNISNPFQNFYQSDILTLKDCNLCYGETEVDLDYTVGTDIEHNFYSTEYYPGEIITKFFGKNNQFFLPNVLSINNNIISIIDYNDFLSAFYDGKVPEDIIPDNFKYLDHYNDDKYEGFDNSERILGYIKDNNVYFKGQNVGNISDILMKCEYLFKENGESLHFYSFSDIIAKYHNKTNSIPCTLIPMIKFSKGKADPEKLLFVLKEFGFHIGIKYVGPYYIDMLDDSDGSIEEAFRVGSFLHIEMERFLFDETIAELIKGKKLKDQVKALEEHFSARLSFYAQDKGRLESNFGHKDEEEITDQEILEQEEKLDELDGKSLIEQLEILKRVTKEILDQFSSYFLSHSVDERYLCDKMITEERKVNAPC